MTSEKSESEKSKKMIELCKTRPIIYSDLDYLKKGSTKFLHDLGHTNEEIAATLDLKVREVENNLSGTGFDLDYKKIKKFEDQLPERIGDTIRIHAPAWDNDDEGVTTEVTVKQCIPKNDTCGLIVEIQKDTDFKLPFVGSKKKGEEIVIPLSWYVP